MTTDQEEHRMPQTDTENPARKPFSQLLREQREGALHDELGDAMKELVSACVDTGKKGTLTLKITCSPQKDEVTMQVFDDLKLALPKHTTRPAVFYPSEDGTLHRDNPRQQRFDNLREVAARDVRTDDDAEAASS